MITNVNVNNELMSEWCIWERYQTSFAQKKDNYKQSNKIIFTFSDLSSLAEIWKNTPYNTPSKIFFNPDQKKIRKLVLNDGSEKIVECLMLFKKGVQPSWEDPANHFGGSLIVELEQLKGDELDVTWKNLIFALIGHSFPLCEHVTGFRMLDRVKKFGLIKLELWIGTGLSKYKKVSEEYKKNYDIREKISMALKNLVGKTRNISVHSIIFKDHYTVNKV